MLSNENGVNPRTKALKRTPCKGSSDKLAKGNLRLAKMRWGALTPQSLQNLKTYSQEFGFSIISGDLLLLNGGWYVTHTGLIRLARRKHCAGIDVKPVPEFSDLSTSRWAFKATVYRSRNCRGFVGYGDADLSNVSPLVHVAAMRVAETRPVNRALRKEYRLANFAKIRVSQLPESNLTDQTRELAVNLAACVVGDPELAAGVVPLLREQDECVRGQRDRQPESMILEAVLACFHEKKKIGCR